MVAQVILFKDQAFNGDHLHVFGAIANLNAHNPSFNDITTSLVVVEGNWQFFKDWQWENPFPAILGPGAYPTVVDVLGAGSNDSITGLRPV